MNPILFFSLVIILSAARPWWPYSAYGRSRHHRPWDWLLDTPSSEDSCTTATETGIRRVGRRPEAPWEFEELRVGSLERQTTYRPNSFPWHRDETIATWL